VINTHQQSSLFSISSLKELGQEINIFKAYKIISDFLYVSDHVEEKKEVEVSACFLETLTKRLIGWN
jgi:hypothetical protein